MFKDADSVGFVVFCFCVLILAFWATTVAMTHSKLDEYKYNDTIEFVDRNTDEVIKQLDNVEFRILDKSNVLYGVKIENKQEALVLYEIPSNAYLRINASKKDQK